MSINNTPLIPWATQNIPTAIQLELNRRKTNRSFNYKKIDGWNKDGGDWEQYKGPMSSWIRVCSNGVGRTEINKSGFVMTGGKSFYQTYGFARNQEGNRQILGYTPDGKPHILDYDKNISQFPIHVPSPEIVRVETVIQKELFRRAWVHWTCFSTKQLEYMTPYFLVPGITVVVEFGWNHFNQKSLINLTDENKLAEYYFSNPYPLYRDNIIQSNGNYDVVYGMVTNFEWSVEGNKFKCMTEITSKDRLYSGIPISTTVTERKNVDDPNTEITYFSSIRSICDTDLIKNLKAIASSDTLDDAENKVSNKQLLQLIRGSRLIQLPKSGPTFLKSQTTSEMKREYWRGIFYGRDEKNINKSIGLDYKWTAPKDGDFDKNQSDENVWVNMGFLVELMNRTIPLPSVKKESGFFEVNVDEAVIGAHPNHISTDGSILLIPNSIAPKYMWGSIGMLENGPGGDYDNQFKDEGKNRKTNKKIKDVNDPLWCSDYQLCQIFKQGIHPHRDNLDKIINSNRYVYSTDRKFYTFPFVTEETVFVKNRTDVVKYDAYFYGYFKDLYFNVKRFIELVKDQSIKTYADLYKAIFDDINKAGGNYWDFSLMPNDNTSQMIVVDSKMLPPVKDVSKPFYFDHLDTDQLMTSLGFKPKMSDAQAFRTVFGSNNNKKSKTIVKEENDLLDYKFDDRILIKNNNNPSTISSNTDSIKDPFLSQIQLLQRAEPINGSCQFTIMVGNKPYFRRLVLPDPEMLNCLLSDQDTERNQRYTGIQPITVEIGLQGIGGLRTFMSFLIRNLPNPYSHKDVAYRIVDVHHVLQDGKWDTVIKAGIIPLRGYIKQKLGIVE